MQHFPILNYQGSKRKLLPFLHEHINQYLDSSSTVLDIFSGYCSVGYSFKEHCTTYANDSEFYAYAISKALLSDYTHWQYDALIHQVKEKFAINMDSQQEIYQEHKVLEQEHLIQEDFPALLELYQKTPTVWNDLENIPSTHTCFELFTTYYSTSYFGILQANQIDSLRYAFQQYQDDDVFYALLSSLFFAMKECVFSKDGHMAQPLNLENNQSKLFKQRKKSIYDLFALKLQEFFSSNFINASRGHLAFQKNFTDLLKDETLLEKVTVIYADPPYTDMQYSRYYHLLTVVGEYTYPKPTIIANKPTKGLYLEGRYQSKLSSRGGSFAQFKELVDFSQKHNKILAISFAYPKDCTLQKTDRYVMSIEQIISYCQEVYGEDFVKVATQDYSHSNHRNSQAKKVLEYLIICQQEVSRCG